MTALFWASIISIFYAYFGYPVLLFLVSLIKKRDVHCQEDYLPSVSLIITVHNEEHRIAKKIQNTLEIEYAPGNLEIIFASDYSTDATEDIIQKYTFNKMRIVRSPYRGGKELAQKCAIEQAVGEIFVFTDVATMLDKDAIKIIVANFGDKSVGCVSSKDRVVDNHGNVSGEGAYVRYEMWLRSLETKANSVVGLSGSFFAARREVCQDWPVNIPSDFNTVLNSIRLGYRGISDPKSIGIYTTVKDKNLEIERKVRTITRGISGLMANKSLLNPLRYGLFSWQLTSHKFVRWMVPWLMIIAFCANVFLAVRRSFFMVLLIGQCIFYSMSYSGSKKKNGSLVIMAPYFFVQANYAILISWVKFLKGERFIRWTPSKR